jgi:hypothetical protein
VRRIAFFISALLSGWLLVACTPVRTNAIDATPTSEPVATATPCTDDPNLVAAVDLFYAAALDSSTTPVHGEPDGRTNRMFSRLDRTDLAAMRNPEGFGTLISLVYPTDGPFEYSAARRAAWLIFDGAIYPVDVDAAQAFGLRWAGYPEDVKQSAGLGNNYFSLSAYGISDFESWNTDTTSKYVAFLNEANELCNAPTLWD